MKQFVIKLLFVLIFIGLLLSGFELYNRENDHSSIAIQQKFLTQYAEEIEGIIIGPSYLWQNIHLQSLDFKVASLALPGSAPNIDYAIFRYTQEIAEPRFYLFELSRSYLANFQTRNFIASNNLAYYFTTINPKEVSESFLTKIPLYVNLNSGSDPSDYDQWGTLKEIPSERNLFQRLDYRDSLIENHPETKLKLKNQQEMIATNKTSYSLDLLRKMVKKCLETNSKVIFISAPKYYLFNQFTDGQNLNQRDGFIKEMVDNQHVFFLNFDHWNEKSTLLFYDINHLNTAGALAFSSALNDSLKIILNRRTANYQGK